MKKQSTLKGATFIIIGRILSKIIGLFRERLLSIYFGTSYVIDVWKLGVPLMGIILNVIVNPILKYGTPNITKAYEEKDIGHMKHNIEVIVLLAGTAGVLLSLTFILFPEIIIKLFLPYILSDTNKLITSINMIRLIGYMSILYTFVKIADQLLVSIHIYTHLAIKDPLINTIWVVTLAILPYPIFIVLGRTLGAIFYLLFIAYTIYLTSRYVKATFSYDGAPSRKSLARDIFKGTLPMYIGGSITLINQFIDRAMAGYLGEGNIAILGYSSIIAGIIGALLIDPFLQSVYPKISQHIKGNNKEYFLREAHSAANIILFLGIPAAAALFIMPSRISFFFFGGNRISGKEIYTIGIVAAIMSLTQLISSLKIYSNALIPLKRTDIGLKIATIVVPFNIVMNYILAFTFNLGVMGLKIATLIAIFISNITQVYILSRILNGLNMSHLASVSIKTLLGTVPMAILIYFLNISLPKTRIFTLLIVFVGLNTYFITAYIIKHETLVAIIEKVTKIPE